jgi:mRNA-degrading endonuclease RelE of RelBE toxin-antitoxin system
VESYRVLVCIEVLQLQKPSRRERDLILSFLESLGSNPFGKGDYEEKDDIDRPVQIKVIGKYALTYWADHAIKEVKVTKIELADRT